ncbi:hypothetical protein ACFX12_003588 [Malus domestica]
MAGPRGVLRYWCRYWRGDFDEKSMKRASSTMGLQSLRLISQSLSSCSGMTGSAAVRKSGRTGVKLRDLQVWTQARSNVWEEHAASSCPETKVRQKLLQKF